MSHRLLLHLSPLGRQIPRFNLSVQLNLQRLLRLSAQRQDYPLTHRAKIQYRMRNLRLV